MIFNLKRWLEVVLVRMRITLGTADSTLCLLKEIIVNYSLKLNPDLLPNDFKSDKSQLSFKLLFPLKK